MNPPPPSRSTVCELPLKGDTSLGLHVKKDSNPHLPITFLWFGIYFDQQTTTSIPKLRNSSRLSLSKTWHGVCKITLDAYHHRVIMYFAAKS